MVGEFFSEGKFRGAKAELNVLSELLIFGSTFTGEIRGVLASQSGAGGTADRSGADFTFGSGRGGCSVACEGRFDEADFAFGSNSRNN